MSVYKKIRNFSRVKSVSGALTFELSGNSLFGILFMAEYNLPSALFLVKFLLLESDVLISQFSFLFLQINLFFDKRPFYVRYTPNSAHYS